ncbi:hypothetical protein A3H85_00215 [Candidatus Daviesbacteria bacterium RIFCSPLOWO2_02_FULL_40_8]|uniref:Uncharacterized protein n=1 Tax=Candidatus Daviesbacteria bacterium RIFCSPLOWO2_01_FULL_40_24 TaxID=1797787 RepID=A0A1F5MJX8_9BACT|nr:MAG: hypothetical protein A2780_01265 [Candidatus Daviesbacteria bacterium RIFCSPHIGHO2_01_FULL_41_45]OGE35509.1 MAG: hypothetical protein A3C32_03615 [Candidatus Daviesbacteria bacterium RIFCSPHIGHO2_02_FULL_41_14]OGE65600.1 MAG: hypothetical protein A3B49_02190 [Candidatus Daviesbacteria bacterium RIFCSPLOWO2_01_FULL_40_24]OGE66531.1 MAG: hypothetical protein A3H85_00215 [Candidatus Daviesbacteria bacterium RIFCSPLOWO2_02_FULL_40_8]
MKFNISRSLNGDKIILIARTPDGEVLLRAKDENEMQKLIEEYNKLEEEKNTKNKPETRSLIGAIFREQTDQNEEPKKFLQNELKEQIEKRTEEIQKKTVVKKSQSEEETEAREILQKELKTKKGKNKTQTGLSSFWNKLK